MDKIFNAFEFIIVAFTIVFLIMKLSLWIKDLIKGNETLSLSEILDLLKTFVPLILGIYLLIEIFESNLNIFCKILLVAIFIVLVTIGIHYESENTHYYKFKVSKGFCTPNLYSEINYLKEKTKQIEEDVIIKAITSHKKQVEFEKYIHKNFNGNDDLITHLLNGDKTERYLLFSNFPDNYQKKLLEKLINDMSPTE